MKNRPLALLPRLIQHARRVLMVTMSVLSIGLVLYMAAPVSALSPADRWHYANLGIEFIDDPCDPDATGSTGGSTGTLTGNDNAEKVFRFFNNTKGLSPEAAAGIIGNLMQESNINPGSNNTAAKPYPKDDPIDPSSIIPGEHWNGGGIVQWEGGRWVGSSGLLHFVAGTGDLKTPQGDGKNWKDLGAQLNFMWAELSGTLPSNKQSGLNVVKTATTAADAAEKFERAYERAGDPRMENRIRYANEALATAQQKGWITATPAPAADPTTPSTTPTTPSSSCNTAAGGAGLVDTTGYAFPLAPQVHKDYGGIPCHNKPITYTTDEKHGSISYPGTVTCHHDNSPAFDLMDNDGGSAVYALTDGKIVNVGTCYSIDHSEPCIQGCSSIQFQANHGTDHYFYWYGHLMNPTVAAEQQVKAGQQIAQTATKSFGSRCWGGGPHLHIDRGCIVNGTAYHGGNDGCRDPAFMGDLKIIWDKLPTGK